MKKDVLKIILAIVVIVICVILYNKINTNEVVEIAYYI